MRKKYERPQMRIIEMNNESRLLSASDDTYSVNWATEELDAEDAI